MAHTKPPHSLNFLLFCSMLFICSNSLAVNECKVEYGYYTGSTPGRDGLGKNNRVKLVSLNSGQTKSQNQNDITYVKNYNKQEVSLEFQAYPNISVKNVVVKKITLEKGDRYPSSGLLPENVSLKSIQCMPGRKAQYSSPRLLMDALRQSNSTSEQMVLALKTNFNLPVQEIALLLKSAGYGGEEIIAALKKQLNFNAERAAATARQQFNGSTSLVAQWLKTAGYSLPQVVRAIDSSEPDPQKKLQALKTSFNASADTLIVTLKNTQKIITTKNCAPASCQQPAQHLKNIGYSLNDTLKSLKTHYDLSPKEAKKIGISVYHVGTARLQQSLAYAGYSAQQITSAFYSL